MATSLATAMESRGKHSWGIYRGDTQEIIKDLGPITRGMQPMALSDSNVMLMHTRHASVGSITKENAHPWRFSDESSEGTGEVLVGIHNGGIGDKDELNTRYHRNFDVDSQHFFQHMVEGLDVTKLRGYGAVAYTYERAENLPYPHVRLGKFNNGMLSIIAILEPGPENQKLEEKEKRGMLGMVFASTEDACWSAVRMAGFPYKDLLNYIVKEDVLYEIRDIEGEGSMYYYVEQKGLDLSYYAKGYAQTQGRANVGYCNANNSAVRNLRPSDIGTTAYGSDISRFFDGLWQYFGSLSCEKCSYVAQVEYRPANEYYCAAHWLQLVHRGDSRVKFTTYTKEEDREKTRRLAQAADDKLHEETRKALTTLMEQVKDEGDEEKEDSGILCDLCPNYGRKNGLQKEAKFFSPEGGSFVCQKCYDMWADEEEFRPISELGKVCGADEEEEEDEDEEKEAATAAPAKTDESPSGNEPQNDAKAVAGVRQCATCKRPADWVYGRKWAGNDVEVVIDICTECLHQVHSEESRSTGPRIVFSSQVPIKGGPKFNILHDQRPHPDVLN
jgi:predicted glutamine amidotransferase